MSRESILSAALQFFAEYGYEGTSTSIAAKMGTNSTILFAYFGSLEALFLQSLEESLARYADRLEHLVQQCQGDSVQQQLYSLLYINALSSAEPEVALSRRARWFPPPALSRHVQAQLARFDERLTGLLTKLFEEGRLRGEVHRTVPVSELVALYQWLFLSLVQVEQGVFERFWRGQIAPAFFRGEKEEQQCTISGSLPCLF